jgi:hypothetical protein
MTGTDRTPKHTRKHAEAGQSYATADVIRLLHQMQAGLLGLSIACLILFALLLAGVR